jgi:hypothetical protein
VIMKAAVCPSNGAVVMLATFSHTTSTLVNTRAVTRFSV